MENIENFFDEKDDAPPGALEDNNYLSDSQKEINGESSNENLFNNINNFNNNNNNININNNNNNININNNNINNNNLQIFPFFPSNTCNSNYLNYQNDNILDLNNLNNLNNNNINFEYQIPLKLNIKTNFLKNINKDYLIDLIHFLQNFCNITLNNYFEEYEHPVFRIKWKEDTN